MNSRIAILALAMAIAVSSLALVITVVGGMASSVSGEAIAFEADALKRDETYSRLPAYQRPKFSRDEPLPLTQPISIYLPLLENEYIKNSTFAVT